MRQRWSRQALAGAATLGLPCALLALLVLALLGPLLEPVQHALYDRVLMLDPPLPRNDITVLEWPAGPVPGARAHADLIDALTAAGAARIVLMAPPTPAPTDSGTTHGPTPIVPATEDTDVPTQLERSLADFEAALRARTAPDRPQVNELLRLWLELGLRERFVPRLQDVWHRLQAPTASQALSAALGRAARVVVAGAPLPGTWGHGQDARQADADGVLRSEHLTSTGPAPPTLSLVAAAAMLDQPVPAWSPGTVRPRLGEHTLFLDAQGRFRPRFYAHRQDRPAFPVMAVEEVLATKGDPTGLDGRTVIVGPDRNATPVAIPGARVSPAQALAQRISALLQAHQVRAPAALAPLGWLLAALAWFAVSMRATLETDPSGPPRDRDRGMDRGWVQGLLWGLGASLALGLMSLALLAGLRLWSPAWIQAALALLLASIALPGVDALLRARRTPVLRRRRLGRYRIESELGRGAMGVVYLGQDPQIGRRVALKTLEPPAGLADAERARVRQRFFAEAAAVGRLSHPHIVQIYDVGEDRELAYIAMELIEGHDLSRHTQRYTLLPVPEVLEHLWHAAEALDYAHTQGVVHRDVKPDNLMRVAASGQIKLTDFGLAGVAEPDAATVLGSPAYMSPEQLSGKALDGRSDLFSLGVSAYQLLTGQLPFRADALPQLMQDIATRTPPAPSRVRRDLPPELDPIVMRLLHKQPDARYARGADLAADLRASAARLT